MNVSRSFLAAVAALSLLPLLSSPPTARAQNNYPLTKDSERNPDVPQGAVTKFEWKSKLFPGTVRDGWVYVPKQYDPKKPACVMVFQDGGGFQDNGGGFRVPIVFDNLIARGEMPVTIGIFLNPGVVPAPNANALPRYNRSFEYDSPTDLYARFLIEEILPEVGKTYNLSQNPNDRALAGSSSGGICAFNAAWQRPDAFRRVLTYIGSFTDLRGGHSFPAWIRKTEPKPLRVFQQDGERDQSIYSGHWFIGNTDVSSALDWVGYDHKWVTGMGSHDGVQARAILPDALRWLWRDWPVPISVPDSTPQPVVQQTLLPKEPWNLVPTPEGKARALAVDSSGDLFLAGPNRIWKVKAQTGAANIFKDRVPETSALAVASNNRLIAAQKGRIVAYDPNGRETKLATGFDTVSLTINAAGTIFAATTSGEVWSIDAKGKKTRLATGLVSPAGIAISPDQTLLFAAQRRQGDYIRSFQIASDGSLAAPQDYFELYAPYGKNDNRAGTMATDSNGWLYASSAVGIQMLDQAGRVNGIVLNPTLSGSDAVVFGGTERTTLFALSDGKLYRRNVKAKGVTPAAAPIKPPGPRL